jgi:uncharacterized protein (TIGR03067 family)
MKMRVLLVLTAGLLAAPQLSAVPNRPAKKKDPVKEEMRKLEGTWECTGLELNGRQYQAEILLKLGNPKLVIKGKKLTGSSDRGFRGQNQAATIDLKIDPKKKPKAIDLAGQILAGQGTVQAIYELKGDTLKTCYSRNGGQRPTEFSTAVGNNNIILTWKRVKK